MTSNTTGMGITFSFCFWATVASLCNGDVSQGKTTINDNAPAAARLFLYAPVSDDKAVYEFRINLDGRLTPLVPLAVHAGQGALDFNASAGTRSAFVVNRIDRSVSQYRISPNGVLAPLAASNIPVGPGSNGLVFAAAGRFAYSPNGANNTISQYRVSEQGILAPLDPPTVKTGDAPASLFASPDNRNLYCSNTLDLTVSQYRIGKDGRLTPLTPPAVYTGGQPGRVVFINSGRYALVGNDGYNPAATPTQRISGSLAIFRVGPEGGLVRQGDPLPTGDEPSLELSPSGKFVYLGSYQGLSYRVLQYAVGPNGALQPLSPPSPPAPVGLTFTPDGRFTYGAGADVLLQSRVNADGTLSPLDPPAVPAPDRPGQVIVDPTGRFVYAPCISREAASIAQYAIQPDGTLKPLSPPSVPCGGTQFLTIVPLPSQTPAKGSRGKPHQAKP